MRKEWWFAFGFLFAVILLIMVFVSNIGPEIRLAPGDLTIDFTGSTPPDGWTLTELSLPVELSTAALGDHYSFTDFDKKTAFWMRFDDLNSSGNFVDLISGYNGTSVNNPIVNSNGLFGDALEFDKSNYVSIPQLGSNSVFSDSFTVSFWMRADDPGNGHQRLIGTEDRTNTGPGWYLRLRNNNGLLQFFAGDGTTSKSVSSATPISDNDWHHVVLSYSNDTNDNIFEMTIHIDTQLQAADPFMILNGTYSSKPLHIGSADGGSGFDGSIDDVLIFDRILSDDEMLSLYNSSANQYSESFDVEDGSSHSFKGYSADFDGNKAQTGQRTVFVDTSFIGDGAINLSFASENNEVEVPQGQSFDFDIKALCEGMQGDCGEVNVFALYNESSAQPDENVSSFDQGGDFFVSSIPKSQEVIVTLFAGAENEVRLFDYDSGFDKWDERIVDDLGSGVDAVDFDDADNDGIKEIVVAVSDGGNNPLYIYEYNVSSLSWKRGEVMSALPQHAEDVEIGDVDNDGENEIVVGLERLSPSESSAEHNVRVYDYSSGVWEESNVSGFTADNSVQDVDIADIDGDGLNEIVVLYSNSLSGDLVRTRVVMHEFSSGAWNETNISVVRNSGVYSKGERLEVGDIDGDDQIEVVVGFHNGLIGSPEGVFVFIEKQGENWIEANISETIGLVDGIDIGDAVGDDKKEIVAISNVDTPSGVRAQAKLFEHVSGTTFTESNLTEISSYSIGRDADVGDANNDGSVDVVLIFDDEFLIVEDLEGSKDLTSIKTFAANGDSAQIVDFDEHRRNPFGCGFMEIGEECLASFSVEALGEPGTEWLFGSGALSDLGIPVDNNLADAFSVRITEPVDLGGGPTEDSNESDDGSSSSGGSGNSRPGGLSAAPDSYWIRTVEQDNIELDELENVKESLNFKERILVKVDGETHHVGVRTLGVSQATIEILSEPQFFVLGSGESVDVDVTEDGLEDFSVVLHSIENNRADLEIIPLLSEEEQEVTQEEPLSEEETQTSEDSESSGSIYLILGILLVLIVGGAVAFVLYRKKKQA